jgi:hypothetical protein
MRKNIGCCFLGTILLSACFVDNPLYCSQNSDCSSGNVCNLALHVCAGPGDGGGNADLSADLRARPDLRESARPDLSPITGCQLVPQAGCPAGMECTTQDDSTTICEMSGPQARGQSCSVADTCAAGLDCLGPMGGPFMCREFCNSDMDCGAVSYCDYGLGPTMKFKVCTQPCNAVFPGSGCSIAGYGCYLTEWVSSGEHTDCLETSAGAAGEGGACTSVNGCQSGLACITVAGSGTCRRVCPAGNSANCNGLTCRPLNCGASNCPTYGYCG